MTEHSLLADYLANLKTELYFAEYTHVTKDWNETDSMPDYSKFYYIVDGEGWIKLGDQEYFPQPGQLILLPEGVSQSFSCISEHTFLKYWCHFTAKIGDVNLFNLLELPHQCTIVDHDTIRDLFIEMIDYSRSNAVHAKLMAKIKLMELFSHFIKNLAPEQIRLKRIRSLIKLSEVLSYIQLHIQKEITITELADVACLHPNYFIRLFKEHMGIPPIQYITRKKIDMAKELLVATSHTVKEIAYLLSFHDMFHFSKQFKKISGLTPTEFRKQKIKTIAE